MMAVKDSERPRYGAVNASRSDVIARLRERIKKAHANDWDETDPLPGILQGMLDLLADDAP